MDKGFNINLNDEIQYNEGGIYSKVVYKDDKLSCTLMCLSKDTHIDTHTSTKMGIVQVLEGKGTFTLCDQEIEMAPGTFITMPAHAPHSLQIDENLTFLLSLYS